jgi:uncharacterized membrane protein
MFSNKRLGTTGRKIAMTCTAAAVASVTAVMVSAGPAFADDVETFANNNTGRCMDGLSTVHAGYSDPCGTQEIAEDWLVHHWNDGTTELQTVNTANQGAGYCLDDSAAGLRTYPCNKSKYQSWFVTHNSDGSITFKNQQTAQCIDDSTQYGLRAIACNGLSYQHWH